VTTAVDAVALKLRAAILDGALAPGVRLREEALSERFQVARHTLRAALRALAAERLVMIEPHRGARVATLDGPQLKALFELRTALEVEAARLLAERCTLPPWPADVEAAAADLDRLCAAFEVATGPADATAGAMAMATAGRPPSRADVDVAHLALHHALVAAAGSPRITQAHAALAAENRLVLLQSRDNLPVSRMAELHRDLLEQLPRLGPEVLRTHLAQGQVYSTQGQVYSTQGQAYSAASGAEGAPGAEERP
jgi:DNA-binding GntR family transcriptional regulator